MMTAVVGMGEWVDVVHFRDMVVVERAQVLTLGGAVDRRGVVLQHRKLQQLADFCTKSACTSRVWSGYESTTEMQTCIKGCRG